MSELYRIENPLNCFSHSKWFVSVEIYTLIFSSGLLEVVYHCQWLDSCSHHRPVYLESAIIYMKFRVGLVGETNNY